MNFRPATTPSGMTSTAPLCAGSCGRPIDSGERPWKAVVGHIGRGPRVYFVCPGCEAEAVPRLLRVVGGGFVAWLPSNRPSDVLSFIWSTLSIAWEDEDEVRRN